VFIRMTRRMSLLPFVLYRLVLGIALLVLII
jgi:undecaprenyl pyrophosphate phosphatase UppP